MLANIVLEEDASAEEVQDLLVQMGMERFISRLPQGLATRIGEGGLELSAGEKQLLCFARVMFRNPTVLVLDEATASIDSETETLMEAVVERAFHGRTSLVIAHRLSTIRRVDRIVVMDRGRIIEQGTHAQLAAEGSAFRRLLEREGARQGTPDSVTGVFC